MLLKQLHPEIKNTPIEIYADNKSLHGALQPHKHVSDKRLRIDIVALKGMLQKQEIHHQICWANK